MVSKLNAAWSNTTNRMVNHATMHIKDRTDALMTIFHVEKIAVSYNT
jgi:hypothetical protein